MIVTRTRIELLTILRFAVEDGNHCLTMVDGKSAAGGDYGKANAQSTSCVSLQAGGSGGVEARQ